MRFNLHPLQYWPRWTGRRAEREAAGLWARAAIWAAMRVGGVVVTRRAPPMPASQEDFVLLDTGLLKQPLLKF